MKEKPGQLEDDCCSWLRWLDFYKNENSFLKVRLSEVVDNLTDHILLSAAENFQSQFILKDELFAQLQHEIEFLRQKLTDMARSKKSISMDSTVLTKHLRLKNKMPQLKQDFMQLIENFNSFLYSLQF
ncbi:MAG: hypothetical protein ABJA78_14845 [Ferruginibacter sp.]